MGVSWAFNPEGGTVKNMKMLCVVFVLTALFAVSPDNAQELKIAHLGDCELEVAK